MKYTNRNPNSTTYFPVLRGLRGLPSLRARRIPILLSLLSGFASAQYQAKDIEALRQKIITYDVTQSAPSAAKIRGWYSASVNNTDLKMMARAYASPNHALYHDAGLANAFHDRLADYCRRDPVSADPNWWFKQVPDPNYIARALLLMGDAVTLADYNAAKKIINRAGLMNESPPYRPQAAGAVGINTIWQMGPEIDNGILKYRLLKDSLLIGVAVDQLKLASLVEQGSEQTLADWSYPFHHWKRYTGGYGSAHSQELSYWAMILSGTSYALPQKTVDDLSRFILEGQQWVIWKDRWDWTVTGREITRGTPGPNRSSGYNIEHAFSSVCDIMAGVDPARAPQYQAFQAALEGRIGPGDALTGDKYFWDAGQLVHRRKGWYAAPAIGGGRELANEVANENVSGKYFGAGVCQIFRSGNEYDGLSTNGNFDWQKLPGALNPEKPIPTSQAAGTESVPGAGTGGVSDGVYGMAGMNQRFEGLSAKRAWFFFDDEFVVLANNLQYSGNEHVTSDLDQCLKADDAGAFLNGTRQNLGGPAATLDGAQWIYNHQIAYLPVSNSAGQYKASAANGIFKLWIDHGVHPANADYAYAVVPGLAVQDIAAYQANLPFHILSNTPAIQAVRHDKLAVTGVAFYGPGTLALRGNLSIAVDLPCFALLREQGNQLEISVSNIQNAGQTLHVSVHADQSAWTTAFPLPVVPYAGQSQIKSLNLSNGEVTLAFKNMDPSMRRTPPANPRSRLSRGALGFLSPDSEGKPGAWFDAKGVRQGTLGGVDARPQGL